MNLFEQLIAEESLFAAWEKVRRNGGAAGVDRQTIAAFSENAFGRLLTLQQHLRDGSYRPRALREKRIPKSSGGMRYLAIPALRDRIAQTAATRVLTPLLDRELEEDSFAYRGGRSARMAIARVAWLRDRGFQWVVDADIRNYFDRIDHDILLQRLHTTLEDHSLLPLIELWLAATLQKEGSNDRVLLTRGVPQGSPISPLLSNLYLDRFDEAIASAEQRLVRFADDFVILCRGQAEAEQALQQARSELADLKLELNPEKTRLTHFEQGFQFLGVQFTRNLVKAVNPSAATWLVPSESQVAQAAPRVDPPPASTMLAGEDDETVAHNLLQSLSSARLPAEDTPLLVAESDTDPDARWLSYEENQALSPLLRTVRVARPGLRLHKESDRLLIKEGREVQASLPLHKVDEIVVEGNQMISTALLRFAAQQGIAVHFTSPSGQWLGHFESESDPKLAQSKAQFRRLHDKPLHLMFARAFVKAKLENCRVLLRRLNRRRELPAIEKAIVDIGSMAKQLPQALKLNQVRGIEGAAAYRYFAALRELLPDSWGFVSRRRQPPPDPFNLLLSYGYGVLFNTLHTLLRRQGLNPWLGHLHAANGRHPSLVSDLMEEFRAPWIDAAALDAIQNHLSPDDFDCATDKCRMRDEARRDYLHRLHNRLRTAAMHRPTGKRLDLHRGMQYQVAHYADVLRGDTSVYDGYRIR